jgi:hypothetical protein
LKIATLLAQYLYSRKKLNLPGFGTFLLDSSFITEQVHPKNTKPITIEGISFEYNPSVKESPDLLQFISENSGKIKALAAADLESHLELAKEFINIGKTFLFEGIGQVSKVQTGGLAFTPGHLNTEKLTSHIPLENVASTFIEEPAADYKNIFAIKKEKRNWKKPIAILLLLGGIVFAIWGGYSIYKRKTAIRKLSVNEVNNDKEKKEKSFPDSVINQTDTITNTTVNQTGNPIIPSINIPTGKFKFIVEIANKERGLKRFSTLKGYGLNIQMETNDSVKFKLFFILPANIADTARMVDSLKKIYTPPGNTAYIEK